MSDKRNALIVPRLDSYVVSGGWVGVSHGSPEPAEQEARDHEANPGSSGGGLQCSSPAGDDRRPKWGGGFLTTSTTQKPRRSEVSDYAAEWSRTITSR